MGPEVAWLRSGRSRRRRGSKDELPRAETPKPGARPTAHANPRPRAQQSARARRGEGPGCWVSIQSTGQQTCKEETASPGWGSAPGADTLPRGGAGRPGSARPDARAPRWARSVLQSQGYSPGPACPREPSAFCSFPDAFPPRARCPGLCRGVLSWPITFLPRSPPWHHTLRSLKKHPFAG